VSEPIERKALPLAFSDPRGQGTPVLFVHGFAHNRSVWEKFATGLPKDLRPISVDLRGHGESPWAPDGAYDLVDYASDLPALLDSLEIERVVVVGHSLGGNVSTLFAAAEPARINALVLVDTGPALEIGGLTHVMDDVGDALRSYASVTEFKGQLEMTHPSGDPEVLSRLAETGVVERIDGRVEPAFDPGVLGLGGTRDPRADPVSLERELWAALGRIRCPVLVVRGGVSAFLTEKVAREMVDEVLVDGRLVTLATAGHSVMIDDAPGLHEALGDFLSHTFQG
jgi:pimeloyl-ACP methyl ester carboxylesterase